MVRQTALLELWLDRQALQEMAATRTGCRPARLSRPVRRAGAIDNAGSGYTGGVKTSPADSINPVPELVAITPSVIDLCGALAANGKVSITINGRDFVPAAKVKIGDQVRPVTFVSATQLTAQLPAADVAGLGEHPVSIVNPAPGGGESSPIPLTTEQPQPAWGRREKALVAGAFAAAILWLGWLFLLPNDSERHWNFATKSWEEPPHWRLMWLIGFVILTAFTIGVGRALTGTSKSLLIDERNKASLSRLQLALWTGLVLSAIATAAAWNINNGVNDPLGLSVPQELWILMGISTTALVGSALIKDEKAKEPTPDLTETQQADLVSDDQKMKGAIAESYCPEQARWTRYVQERGGQLHVHGSRENPDVLLHAHSGAGLRGRLCVRRLQHGNRRVRVSAG